MRTSSRTTRRDVALQLLPGADGEWHSLSALAGRTATVILFMANGCPTVRAYEDRLLALASEWRPAGVELIGVNSNNASLSPPDTLSEMTDRARRRRYTFPYLKDVDGKVARAYEATCTPHAFVVDAVFAVLYCGRIDDSRLGQTISRADLAEAVQDVIAGRPVVVTRTEPFGCSIVW
jgi:thiol-disulfide isomerase/thioredoxin